MPEDPDVLIVGAGVAGSFVARALPAAGRRCLLLEAGFRFEPGRYPRKEIDANSQLYWSGGLELNTAADIAFLRPKCVGGGSIVNQALVDRFDDDALDSWRKVSGVPFFTRSATEAFYERAEAEVEIRTIPAERRNRNALIFQEGFEKNGFRCAPLLRAQGDCRWEEGNDCIECLAGCPIQSKQSTPWTALAKAEATGLLTLVPEVEVQRVWEDADGVGAEGVRRGGPASVSARGSWCCARAPSATPSCCCSRALAPGCPPWTESEPTRPCCRPESPWLLVRVHPCSPPPPVSRRPTGRPSARVSPIRLTGGFSTTARGSKCCGSSPGSGALVT